MPHDSQFPTIVCEAGWAETEEELREDARLWLQHTGGQTKVVIVVSFSEKRNRPSALQAQAANGGESGDGEESGDEERATVEGINEKTNLNELTKKITRAQPERKAGAAAGGQFGSDVVSLPGRRGL